MHKFCLLSFVLLLSVGRSGAAWGGEENGVGVSDGTAAAGAGWAVGARVAARAVVAKVEEVRVAGYVVAVSRARG